MNEIINLLRNQSSTRKNQFSNIDIRSEDIETIKASVLKTANASNRQSYSVIVLDTNQAISLGLTGNKVFLFCIDFYRLHRLAELLNQNFDSQYLMQFVTALTDISMLAQSTILAAQSLEIDTLITNEIYHNKLDKAFDSLNIPEKYVFPMLAVCLGYSNVEGKAQKGRLALNQIFNDGKYKQLMDDEVLALITEYDDQVKNIGLVKDWDEKGYQHYLDWFFEKWSPVIGSRDQSDTFIKALKKHEII